MHSVCSSNVLLDKDFNAIVGDFGFSLVNRNLAVRWLLLHWSLERKGILLQKLSPESYRHCVMCTAVEWLVNHRYILIIITNIFIVNTGDIKLKK